MSELKPCPFCGSDDLVMSGREEYAFMTGKRMEFYRVKCDTCGAMVDNDFKRPEDAIKAWNGRAGEVEKVGEWTEKDGIWFECSMCGCYSYDKLPNCPDCGIKMEAKG